MSKAKPTPGPWRLDGEDIIERSGNLRAVYVAQDSELGGRIGQCFANCLVTTDAECYANARLIAAAPDLLEALTLARTAFKSIANGIPAHEEYAAKCAAALTDAIAKAEGRS